MPEAAPNALTGEADAAAHAQYLCESAQLVDGGSAVAFDLYWLDQPLRAFALRYAGTVYAYLNRCSHVSTEMDWQPNRFFDSTGHWLICATHGALYSPRTGQCQQGPCRGGLVAVPVSETQGRVYWHTSSTLRARPS